MSSVLKVIQELHREALENATNNAVGFIKHAEDVGINLSRKQLSEMLSGIIETSFENLGQERGFDIVAPKRDDKSDLEINGENVEIKTKHISSDEWRGGAYSKRSAHYIFITFDIVNGTPEWFMIYKYVNEDEWRGGNTNNYYVT